MHVGAVRSSLAAAAAAMAAAGVGRGTLRGSMMLLQSLRASAAAGEALCCVHCGYVLVFETLGSEFSCKAVAEGQHRAK